MKEYLSKLRRFLKDKGGFGLPRAVSLGLLVTFIEVYAYDVTYLSNRVEGSLDKCFGEIREIFEGAKTNQIILLCGEKYKENAQLAREMEYPEIADKIIELSEKPIDEIWKNLGLEDLKERLEYK